VLYELSRRVGAVGEDTVGGDGGVVAGAAGGGAMKMVQYITGGTSADGATIADESVGTTGVLQEAGR
jgi:hypothetical protein